MLLIAVFLLALLAVPLAGGQLRLLADVRIRAAWLLPLALLLQIVIISVLPQGSASWHSAAHLSSYALAVAFLGVNRQLPGMWLVCVGGAMNVLAVAANTGVMPATAQALAAAHRPLAEGFSNSAALGSPRLALLGDVFAWPAPLPLANVFSAGDVLIALGAAAMVHQLTGSRWVGLTRRSIEVR